MLWVSTVTLNTRVIKKHKIRMRFFGLKWFGRTNPSGLLKTKIFSLLVSNSPRYSTLHSQYTYRFIPRILRIWTDSFCLFSLYKQVHSAYSQFTTDSFRIFSVYELIHSAYSTNTHSKIRLKDIPYSGYSLYLYRLTPCALSIQPDSFRLFSVYVQIHSPYSKKCGPTIYEYSEWNYFLHNF
jgi:hypothetical protein